jgi:phospholipid/cholesterol/gamma-HCH transport system substrate-binding protein
LGRWWGVGALPRRRGVRCEGGSLSRRTEIQVGLTVIVALAILIAGVVWLKDYSLVRDTHVYRVSFPQAGGLSASDEVHVNGLRRGEVKWMRLVGDHVEVELGLSKSVVLTTDSRVAIRNVGLMGERIIAVDLKATGRPYRPDEIVPGTYEPGLGEVMGQLGSTFDAVAGLSVELQRLAGSMEKEGRLSSTIRNFNSTTEELRLTVSENRALLRSTLENLSEASQTAKRLTTDRESELRQALDHFSSAAEKIDDLVGRLDSLRTTVQQLTTRVDRGQGTLGRLVQDDQLYADLNASVQSLKSLIEDIRKNPRKYLKVSLF